MTAIALIPARGGSKRIASKNIKQLNGVPLLAYTIRAAMDSGCFSRVLVSSDHTETLTIASDYGADVVRRPDEFATDTSPDIFWVRHALKAAQKTNGETPINIFSILRPTSPFRLPETIQRAFSYWWEANTLGKEYSSLRAMERAGQHPGKMWQRKASEAVPLLPQPATPFHDSQYAALPEVWVQNASLEIAWTDTVELTGTISGPRVLPFETVANEGFDLNTERDWLIAEQMVIDGVPLPQIPDKG